MFKKTKKGACTHGGAPVVPQSTACPACPAFAGLPPRPPPDQLGGEYTKCFMFLDTVYSIQNKFGIIEILCRARRCEFRESVWKTPMRCVRPGVSPGGAVFVLNLFLFFKKKKEETVF